MNARVKLAKLEVEKTKLLTDTEKTKAKEHLLQLQHEKLSHVNIAKLIAELHELFHEQLMVFLCKEAINFFNHDLAGKERQNRIKHDVKDLRKNSTLGKRLNRGLREPCHKNEK